MSDAEFECAKQSMRAGEFTQAEQLLRNILKAEPDRVDVCLALGQVLARQGAMDSVLDLMSKLINKHGNLHPAHLMIAKTLNVMGRNEEALAELTLAGEKCPGQSQTHLAMGDMLAQLSRHEEAIKAYDTALSIEPDRFEAIFNRSNSLANLQRYEEALVGFDQVLVKMPDSVETLHRKAAVLTALGRHAEAGAAIDNVIRLQPSNVRALLNKASNSIATGDVKTAAGLVETVIRLDPGNRSARNLKQRFVSLRRIEFGRELLECGPGDLEAIEKYHQVFGVKPELPVVRQQSGLLMDPVMFAPGERSFNASIAEYEGRRLLAYRHEFGGDMFTVRMLEIDDCNQAKDEKPVRLPDLKPMESWEDPRLFHHDSSLWICWVSTYHVPPFPCQIVYGRLQESADKWEVAEYFVPQWGMNSGEAKPQERNWQFFTSDGRLYAQYYVSPHVCLELQGETVVNVYQERGIDWPWGSPSGGTPPVPYDDNHFITFFHAFQEHPLFNRKYNVGALVFERAPPFKQVKVSSQPILSGSEFDPYPTNTPWRPLCVFPQGLLRDGGSYILSSGVNDCRVALSAFKMEDLRLDSIKSWITSPPFKKIKLLSKCLVWGFERNPGEIVVARSKWADELINTGKARPAE